MAEEKLRLFWADSDMTALRTAIRRNLGLDWPEQSGASGPELPGSTAVASLEALKAELTRAIAAAEQPPVFDISALEKDEHFDLTVKNLYYTIINAHPEYKYAYDLTASVEADGTLRCTISYMPYRTGNYPADFQGTEVDSLSELVQTARAGLSQGTIDIRITDPTLAVDDMNKALQQVGGGWLLCQLNRDSTAITVTPQNGLTHAQALERLAETQRLAEQIYGETVTADMDQQEKAEALYSYLTEQVRYDFRYYGQPGEMPYESTTAYGALHDHLFFWSRRKSPALPSPARWEVKTICGIWPKSTGNGSTLTLPAIAAGQSTAFPTAEQRRRSWCATCGSMTGPCFWPSRFSRNRKRK